MEGMARAVHPNPGSAPVAMLLPFSRGILGGRILMPAPGARARAKALGLKTYTAEKPCKNGHMGERSVSGGNCLECQRQWFVDNAEHRRQYINEWQQSPEHKAYMKAYYEANQDKWKADYKPEAEVSRARSAEYRRRHPEKAKAAVKRWQDANREAVRAHLRNNKAKRKGSPGKHTADDIRALFELQGGRCAYCNEVLTPRPPKHIVVAEPDAAERLPTSRLIVCGCGSEFWSSGIGRPPVKCPACRKKRSPLPVAYHVDHDMPIARGGSNDPENLVLTCPRCNQSKQALTGGEFRARRREVA